tara:strand:+ start:4846 stop:5820 length:975 start_codon:yes stop_codon:yes gene_type:complete
MKILAVDDDPLILELLTTMAARVGFTDISTASSGETALDMLNDGRVVFDCLLLDISMPGMDGIELCGLARALPAYSKTPIIMLTAMADKNYIDRAFSAGATDYSNKPFDIVELHARLRMAEELVATQQMAISGSTTGDRFQFDDAHRHAFDLSDEVRVEGAEALIRYNALKNYLTQLSSAGTTSSQVVAVKIDRIEGIYAQASSEEFLYALTEAADAISDALKTNSYMMAYAGNGTFVVVSGKATLESSAGLEIEIQNLLDERETEYDNGGPLDIEISIGNPIRPSTNKTQHIRKTFDRAIARAESRVLRKQDETRSPNIRLIG